MLAAFLAYGVFCRGRIKELRRINDHVREVAAEAAEVAEMQGVLGRGKVRLAEFETELARLHKRIPDDLDTDQFLKELNAVAG